MGRGKSISRPTRNCYESVGILYWGFEKYPMKINYQRTCTRFLEKYCGLSLYDINYEKKYFIDDEYINFWKGDVYALIGNPDNPDVTSTDHEYFSFMINCLTES